MYASPPKVIINWLARRFNKRARQDHINMLFSKEIKMLKARIKLLEERLPMPDGR